MSGPPLPPAPAGIAWEEAPPDRRAAAHNPATPRDVLATLVGDASLWVRRAAGANPSTPRQMVRLLVRAGARPDLTGYAAPEPSLGAGELELLIEGGGEWARCVAARHPLARPDQLQRLAGDPAPAVRLAVAAHPGTPAEVLDGLMLDAAEPVREAAAAHAHASATRLSLIARAARGGCLTDDECAALEAGGPWGRALLAANPFTPAQTLDRLAGDPLWWVRAALTDNPDAPPSVLRPLLRIDAVAVRAKLARHSRCPADVLRALADDADVTVRGAVAAHRNSPLDVLAQLAQDGAVMVRAAVGLNPATPSSVIDRLVRAGSTSDLLGLGSPDPTMPPDELVAMARGGGWARQLAAMHPATPTRGLALLVGDANFLVRDAVTRLPNCPRDMIDLLVRAGCTADLQAFDRPDATLSLAELRQVMASGPWGRQLAARHPRADAVMLDALARDRDWQVRRAVALHVTTPEPVLVAISGDDAADVRWSLLKRPTLPETAWARLAEDALPQVRLAVARDARTPAPVRQRLSRDSDESVRAAAMAPD